MGQKIAFIGSGHIAEILISRFISSKTADSSSIVVSGPNISRIADLKLKYGISAASDNIDAAHMSDIIFVCVLPGVVPAVINDLKSVNMGSKILISTAAGIPLSLYESSIDNVKAARILPNPPSRVGEGAVPLTFSSSVLPEEKAEVLALIDALGRCFSVTEDKIDIFTSIVSPAPLLYYFDSMIDSAVLCGMDYPASVEMVFQTIKGCLKMWEESGTDIKELITQACTPAGTSVESLRVMDRMCFRSAVKESYYAAWQRSKKLGSGEK
ncbi:MAG: pyrroline-5-carboxylate reductase [Synergistaceae bacterium]|nr:pyrroline-5-carboxylate reductase [Synergistaceae bacterium]